MSTQKTTTKQVPLMTRKSVIKHGGTYYVSIPPEWFRKYGVNPKTHKLLVLQTDDIYIVNPMNEKAITDMMNLLLIETRTRMVSDVIP